MPGRHNGGRRLSRHTIACLGSHFSKCRSESTRTVQDAHEFPTIASLVASAARHWAHRRYHTDIEEILKMAVKATTKKAAKKAAPKKAKVAFKPTKMKLLTPVPSDIEI